MRTTFLLLLAVSALAVSVALIVPRSALESKTPPSLAERLNAGRPWPPRPGVRYPDLILTGPDGACAPMSAFEGRVLVVEPADGGLIVTRYGGRIPVRVEAAGPTPGAVHVIDRAFVLRAAYPTRGPDVDDAVARLLEAPARLTVAEAYAAIPHRRIPFDPGAARMPVGEAVFLARLFALTDQAVAARVQALRDGRRDAAALDLHAVRARRITAELEGLEPPAGLGEVRDLVRDAIRAQGRYFAEWRRAGATFPHRPGARIREHVAVRDSSRMLRRAYGRLVDRYGNGTPNRNAFFDHLCALDFL